MIKCIKYVVKSNVLTTLDFAHFAQVNSLVGTPKTKS